MRASFTSGSPPFLEYLKEQLKAMVGLMRGKISPVTRGYHLRYLSIPECLRLYNFVYRGESNLYIRKKKGKFEKFISLKTKEKSK
jgi:hypothetical protein